MALALTRQQWIKRFDPMLLILSLTLCLGSLVAIHSAMSAAGSISTYVIKQFVGILLGFGAFAFMARTDYRAVMASSRSLYTASLVMLALVLVPGIGADKMGAQRWIDFGPINIQPSEIAKVLLILTLGAFLERNRDSIHDLAMLGRSLLHIAVPMLLIFKQPDLGTSLVLVAAWFAMTFIAGARPSHLALVALLGLSLFSLGWATGVVKEYQKKRLTVFLSAEKDTTGAGYQLYRSKVAVGSGQVFGKGLFNGDMKRLKYVPERHTDFIFTVVAEETGFVGSVTLIGIYLLLILRMIMTVLRSEDPLGQVIATGVAAMFTFHTVVNVGMNIGVMPITGVPLPLFSYGPSAVIASLAALGLVESVHLRRHKISF
ncbi:MAG: rod shape-determining protein RodA [Armatimonadetes bacterium]|nr:rod shape-determining protein RodA [Armatimonadota bacterium]